MNKLHKGLALLSGIMLCSSILADVPARPTIKPAPRRPATKLAPKRPATKPAPKRPATKPAPKRPATKPETPTPEWWADLPDPSEPGVTETLASLLAESRAKETRN